MFLYFRSYKTKLDIRILILPRRFNDNNKSSINSDIDHHNADNTNQMLLAFYVSHPSKKPQPTMMMIMENVLLWFLSFNIFEIDYLKAFLSSWEEVSSSPFIFS